MVLVSLSSALARSATLRVDARLRQGPGAATEMLGWVAAGTTVEVVSEAGGWREVRTPDGKSGFIWGEHFTDSEAVAQEAPKAAAPPAAPPAPPPRTTADELRDLRADLSELRQRPAPAAAGDVERLRAEVERLRGSIERLEGQVRPVHPPADAPIESTPGLVPAVFILGTGFGWMASRLLRRRRDRRQSNRLRL